MRAQSDRWRKVFVAMAVLSGLGALAQGIVESRSFGVIRVVGKRAVVYQTAPPHEKKEHELGFEFLLARTSRDGRSLIGWGFPLASNGISTSHAVFVICHERCADAVQLPGFINPVDIALAPDRERLAVIATSRTTRQRGLYLLQTDAVDAHSTSRLIYGDDEPLGPGLSWSPDGQRLLFEAGGKIQAVNLASAIPAMIASGTDPSWSPDGRWIAYLDNSRIMLKDVNDNRAFSIPGTRRFISVAAWSPDSKHFLIAEDRGVPDRECRDPRRLVTVSVPGLQVSDVMGLCNLKPELFHWVDLSRVW